MHMAFRTIVTDVNAGTKLCPRCGESKPLTDFGRSSGRRGGGWISYCRPCYNAYQREKRMQLTEAQREARAAWFREYRQRRPDIHRAMELRKRFGIEPAQYEALLEQQRGGCAICAAEPTAEKWGVLHVDHCHSTGLIRGLLCARCNVGLGQFNDSPDRLRAAADYLDR